MVPPAIVPERHVGKDRAPMLAAVRDPEAAIQNASPTAPLVIVMLTSAAALARA